MSSESESDQFAMNSESDIEEQDEGDESELEVEDQEKLGSGEENAKSGSEDEEEESGSEEELGNEEENAESGSEEEEEESEGEGEEIAESSSEEENEAASNSKVEEGKSPKAPKKEKIPFDQPKNTKKYAVLEKYEKLKGKSLYVRFPHCLPTDQAKLEKSVKDLCSRIVKVRRPRQKSTRFCLVDFDNPEDRTKAMKELRKVEIDGKKLHVEIPKTEKEDFVMKLIEKRAQKKAERRAKAILKKATKGQKTYTSTLIVQNIPSKTTMSDIKQLFPKAIDVKMNFVKGDQDTTTASVTLPTPKDATKARKKKYNISGKDLKITFAIQKKGKYNADHPEKAKQNPSQANGGEIGPHVPQKKVKGKHHPKKAEQNPNKVSGPAIVQNSPKKGKHKLQDTSSDTSPSPKKVKKNISGISKGKGNEKPKPVKKFPRYFENVEEQFEDKLKKKNKKVPQSEGSKHEENKAGFTGVTKMKMKMKNKKNKQNVVKNLILQDKAKMGHFKKANKAGKPFKNKSGKPFKNKS